MKLRFKVAGLFVMALGVSATCNVSAAVKTINVKTKGTPSIRSLQPALDKAKNDKKNYYVINVEKGTYKMTTKVGLHIYSNTTLNMQGVTIKRTAKEKGGVITFGDPRREKGKSKTPGGGYTTGKYNRAHNIIINGGTIDLGKNNVKYTTSMMTFSHVQNVTIKNFTFKQKPTKKDDAHPIEFGAAKNITIHNCKFLGNHRLNVAIQLESARNGVAHSDLMGKLDGTKTKNVTISNCYFSGYNHTIGTQHGSKGDLYTGIVIKDNVFNNVINKAIYAYNYRGKITGNTVQKSGKKKKSFKKYFFYARGKKNKLSIKKNKIR